MICLVVSAPPFTPPRFDGDPAHLGALEQALRDALADTAAFGTWPAGRWSVRLHQEAASFEQATAAPTGRSAQWVGATLHLRPWEQLRRRDLGAILRHELTHRRLSGQGLRRWQEESRCLWAESHRKPPGRWPPFPTDPQQGRLDRALAGGTTREQAWAYRWLRAWLHGAPLPAPPDRPLPLHDTWAKETLSLAEDVTVVWPPERLRGPLAVNGRPLPHDVGRSWRFQGQVRFSEGFPVGCLDGVVRVSAAQQGWRLAWTTTRSGWVAAATEGELGADAPHEARRALAAVLERWLVGHAHQHPGGQLCPLTHCAVVRGAAGPDSLRASATAPELAIDPRWAFFTGSAGHRPLSPHAVWGEGPSEAARTVEVPGDRWQSWVRTLTPAQVAVLKGAVKPGLQPGQVGITLGGSGPYAVERLRLATGRRFGWTLWPSNACEATSLPNGALHLRGWGWGHNVGLCLATARFRAAQGAPAEQILGEAFPASWRRP